MASDTVMERSLAVSSATSGQIAILAFVAGATMWISVLPGVPLPAAVARFQQETTVDRLDSQEDRQSHGAARRLAETFRARHGGLRDRPLAAGERITLSTRKADLVEVLRAFAILTNVNLVVDPGVQGQVTVELNNVAWEQALAVILRTHGLAAELDGRIWRVRGPE